MLRPTLDALRLALAIGVISSTSLAALDEPSLCGNGKLDPGEQCDDGNVKPLDGCSAICEIEQPTSCKNSTEKTVRAVLGDDPEFGGMLTRAQTLGYVTTRLKRPFQCSEGNAPTTYMAMLRPKDRRQKHALIVYRTDMPQWMRCVVVYTAGDLDQYITMPLVTLHVDRRNDPPTVEVLDPRTGKRVEAAPPSTLPSTPRAAGSAPAFTGMLHVPFGLPREAARYVPQ